jgi:hypothetical protein
MNTLTYSQKLRNPKWQKKRLEILQRDKFTCQLCLDTETELQIHHKEYEKGKEPWEYEPEQLTTLCRHCHNFVTEYSTYPYKIIKKIFQGTPALLAITEVGLTIDHGDHYITISHFTLKEVVQTIINYWLLTEQEDNLIDKV